MKFLSLLALAVGVSAFPTPWNKWGNCLSDSQAQYYVDQSIIFLQHKDQAAAKAAAYAIFSPSIVEFGDSINALRGDALGTQVENGITTYVTDTLSTPPIDQINTLNIVHDCNQISWHWQFIGIGPQRIQGFTLMEIDNTGKIAAQYVEFNSLTWATDIGFTVTPPTSGPFAGGGK